MGKKPIVSVTYENIRISIKNSLPYLKCVLRLSCVVHGHKSARGPHRRDVTHILNKVSCFLLKSSHFLKLRKRQVFSNTNPYILNVTPQCRYSPMLIFRAWPTCGENELRERIPVPQENFFNLFKVRACCEGYFCLLFL